MEQLIFRPKLYRFDTCAEFAEAFALGKDDLVLTLHSVFTPYFDPKKTPVQTLFLDDYGKGEPTDDMVNAVIQKAAALNYRRLVAIGGGSVLDTAKVLAVSGGRDTDTLYDNKDSLTREVSLILVPTTCGTGSEVTNIAIMTRQKLGVKMGLTCEATYGDTAVLIPELLKSIPFSVFATSSIDALVHAVESYLSPNATPYTRILSKESICRILDGYQQLLKAGKEHLPEFTDQFLFAANIAGLAFAQRRLSRGAWREQLRHVHRRFEKIYANPIRRRHCRTERTAFDAAALRGKRGLRRAGESFEPAAAEKSAARIRRQARRTARLCRKCDCHPAAADEKQLCPLKRGNGAGHLSKPVLKSSAAAKSRTPFTVVRLIFNWFVFSFCGV